MEHIKFSLWNLIEHGEFRWVGQCNILLFVSLGVSNVLLHFPHVIGFVLFPIFEKKFHENYKYTIMLVPRWTFDVWIFIVLKKQEGWLYHLQAFCSPSAESTSVSHPVWLAKRIICWKYNLHLCQWWHQISRTLEWWATWWAPDDCRDWSPN